MLLLSLLLLSVVVLSVSDGSLSTQATTGLKVGLSVIRSGESVGGSVGESTGTSVVGGSFEFVVSSSSSVCTGHG
jgi:hypothetical protein